ncbi:MAG TPA: glycosyltransferase [Candidatus Binataceae bacterium]|nr:glycosyltransferase [Candidatus Binataceae bacterium]
MRNIRLLSIIDYTTFSGPHNHDLCLRKIFDDNGVDTTVLLPNEPGDALVRLRAGGVKVLTCPSHRRCAGVGRATIHARYLAAFARNVRFVRRAIREFDINLVQLADPFHPHGAVAAKLEGCPVVTHVVGMGGSLAARMMGSLACRWADVILSTGVRPRAAYPGLRRLRRHMVSYFPPIDIAMFRPDVDRKRAARAELGLAPEEIAIGYIARLHPEKDHHTCVRGAALLHKRFPNVRFIMMGGVHGGYSEYLSSIWKTAEALGLRPGTDVVHKDAGARVADLAQAFDVGWSTGFQEGATSSVGEAMALGIPVVGAGNSAVREMIEEGVSGFLVGVGQSEDLARVTSALIEDEMLRERMGRAARERAVRLFSTEVCARLHLEAYDVALSGVSGNRRKRPDTWPATRKSDTAHIGS